MRPTERLVDERVFGGKQSNSKDGRDDARDHETAPQGVQDPERLKRHLEDRHGSPPVS